MSLGVPKISDTEFGSSLGALLTGTEINSHTILTAELVSHRQTLYKAKRNTLPLELPQRKKEQLQYRISLDRLQEEYRRSRPQEMEKA